MADGSGFDPYSDSSSQSFDYGSTFDPAAGLDTLYPPTTGVPLNADPPADPNALDLASWTPTLDNLNPALNTTAAPDPNAGFVVPAGLNSFDPAVLQANGISPSVIASAQEQLDTLNAADSSSADKVLAQQYLDEIDQLLQNSNTIDPNNGAGSAKSTVDAGSHGSAPSVGMGPKSSAAAPVASPTGSPLTMAQLAQSLSHFGTSLTQALSGAAAQSRALLGTQATQARAQQASLSNLVPPSSSLLILGVVALLFFAVFMMDKGED